MTGSSGKTFSRVRGFLRPLSASVAVPNGSTPPGKAEPFSEFYRLIPQVPAAFPRNFNVWSSLLLRPGGGTSQSTVVLRGADPTSGTHDREGVVPGWMVPVVLVDVEDAVRGKSRR